MKKYLRFVFGLRRYFKSGLTPDHALELARALLKKRISSRNENFLSLLERGIFGFPKSPYLKLLDPKKIKFADLKKQVEKNGIEATMSLLQKEGIYFTVDEFKGKTEVVRGNIKFRCTEKMFDNPFLSTAYEVRSGATRSAGTRIKIDFDYLTQRSLYDAFLLNVHSVLKSPIANWFPLFPGAPGINSSLRFSHIGNPPKKWFSQVEKARIKVNWERRLGTSAIFLMGRLQGIPMAKPEFVSLNHALVVAQWADKMIKEHGSCVVYTFATSAVRVCMAALENNLAITGTRFLVTGEPLTPQKKMEIESAGAKAVPVYGISEAGVIAAGGESSGPESDHCYLYKDTTAVITHKHEVGHSDIVVDSFLFTSLLYESPKLLLNVGMGDFGNVYTRPDQSEFGKLGFDTHISNIRSYEKLTGEGVSFVDTDFITIIEKKLPERFGGQSTDYQLVEEEDEKGLNRLKLLISPGIGKIDDKNVIDTFLRLLKDSEQSHESWGQSGTEMWNQARTVRVLRANPLSTRSGKILPFHIERT